ncbi:AAA family ATPase [Gluconobacter cerinus]|uniref:AAA family ATPase n=1 Tax=Gluconobacter cerinus TaxID=38307 RepID=UPI001B8C2C4C|nr:AAA family ATPase [Gluconobacter cerinus]MBS1038096.1 AAA family ATPase [Gluconobacter cerinus]
MTKPDYFLGMDRACGGKLEESSNVYVLFNRAIEKIKIYEPDATICKNELAETIISAHSARKLIKEYNNISHLSCIFHPLVAKIFTFDEPDIFFIIKNCVSHYHSLLIDVDNTILSEKNELLAKVTPEAVLKAIFKALFSVIGGNKSSIHSRNCMRILRGIFSRNDGSEKSNFNNYYSMLRLVQSFYDGMKTENTDFETIEFIAEKTREAFSDTSFLDNFFRCDLDFSQFDMDIIFSHVFRLKHKVQEKPYKNLFIPSSFFSNMTGKMRSISKDSIEVIKDKDFSYNVANEIIHITVPFDEIDPIIFGFMNDRSFLLLDEITKKTIRDIEIGDDEGGITDFLKQLASDDDFLNKQEEPKLKDRTEDNLDKKINTIYNDENGEFIYPIDPSIKIHSRNNSARDCDVKCYIKKPTDIMNIIQKLKEVSPHAHKAIDAITETDIRSVTFGKHIRNQPILLVGPPGAGKTNLARTYCKMMDIPFRIQNVASMHDGLIITGTNRSYQDAKSSALLHFMMEKQCANPVFLFDEVDKTERTQVGSFVDAMLPLMEEQESKEIRDLFFDSPVNYFYSKIIMTANDLSRVPDAFKSRCKIIHVPAPSPEHLPTLIQSLIHKICEEEGSHPMWYQFNNAEIEAIKNVHTGDIRLLKRYVEEVMKFKMQNQNMYSA